MKIKNLKRYRRHALLSANFFSVFGWALLSPLYALYVTEIGGNAQVAALLWSFYTLVGGVLIIGLGWLEDRLIHKERLILLGYVLQTLGALLLFIATDVRLAVAAYGVYAVGTGFVTPVWKQTFSRVEIKGKEATEWGIFHGGNMLLISAAAALSSVIYGYAGFKGILGLMLAAHVFAAILGLRLSQTAPKP